MLHLRIGVLLGLRHIQHMSLWATFLIVFIVVCTFINLVAVGGILGGIVQGALTETRVFGVGDLAINPINDEDYVLETERIERELATYPEIKAFSSRYRGLATIEANYKDRDLSSKRDLIAAEITGIDPVHEDETLHLASLVAEGSYFKPDDTNAILIGKFFIDRYAEEYGDIYNAFKDVYPGDMVRVTVGNQSKEFVVRGIIDSKIDFIGLSIYIPEKEFRRIFNRENRDADDISILLNTGVSDEKVKERLMKSEVGSLGNVGSFYENIPKFIHDVEDTFSLLGNIIGFVGITVASITVFIIIFINILMRRRQIGILKAIGISKRAIQYAYMTQALIYAIVGSCIGVAIVTLGLVPYFLAHPIDFPFSDVSLETSTFGIAIRVLLMVSIMGLAGLLPAWLTTQQNTLNAILGRKSQ